MIDPRGLLHERPFTHEGNYLVLPTSHQEQALGVCHDDFGHFGIKHTLHFLQERFF